MLLRIGPVGQGFRRLCATGPHGRVPGAHQTVSRIYRNRIRRQGQIHQVDCHDSLIKSAVIFRFSVSDPYGVGSFGSPCRYSNGLSPFLSTFTLHHNLLADVIRHHSLSRTFGRKLRQGRNKAYLLSDYPPARKSASGMPVSQTPSSFFTPGSAEAVSPR